VRELETSPMFEVAYSGLVVSPVLVQLWSLSLTAERNFLTSCSKITVCLFLYQFHINLIFNAT